MRVATQTWLAPDPVLPQRDLLLDSDFVAGRLTGHFHRPIEHCSEVKVKYRAGESLRVLHRVTVGGQDLLVGARTFPLSDRSAARDRLAKLSRTEHNQDAFLDAPSNTIFWEFPCDPKIGNLKAIAETPETLSSIFGSSWKTSRVVAYAPEKCATLRCLNEDGETLAYSKVYTGNEGERCAEIYGQLCASIRAAGSPLQIPQALEYIGNCATLLIEAISGTRLDQAAAAEGFHNARALGGALAWLHSLPPHGRVPRFSRLDPERLQNAAFVLGLARPDVASMAAQLADELCASYLLRQEPLVCLHGDVHPKNAVLREGRLVLIDLDQASLGPAAADLGSFCAALRYHCCTRQLPKSAERELRNACLEGYGRVRELPHPDSLDWHTAAALLAERALRSVSRVRREGLSQLPAILTAALKIVCGKDVR
jgi:phosphotransferase family enzyme